MKNLTLHYKIHEEFDEKNIKFYIRHPFENVSFVYNGEEIKIFNHATGDVENLGSFPDCNAMEYIQLSNALCWTKESGEIVMYYLDTKKIETVGMLQDGITAMCWSPDQELVVFVTRYLTIK
jgi:hypothetical protein